MLLQEFQRKFLKKFLELNSEETSADIYEDMRTRRLFGDILKATLWNVTPYKCYKILMFTFSLNFSLKYFNLIHVYISHPCRAVLDGWETNDDEILTSQCQQHNPRLRNYNPKGKEFLKKYKYQAINSCLRSDYTNWENSLRKFKKFHTEV